MYIDRLVLFNFLLLIDLARNYLSNSSSSAIKNCRDVIILWACPILTCQLQVHVNFENIALSYCPDKYMRLFSGIYGILRPDYRLEDYYIQSSFPSILSCILKHLRRNQCTIEIAKEWFVIGFNMCAILSTYADDDNRIVLQPMANSPSDYINGSYIDVRNDFMHLI